MGVFMADKRVPSPEEIQKEFEKVVKDKFGGNIQFHTSVQGMPKRPMDSSELTPSLEEQEEKRRQKRQSIRFDYKPKEVKSFLDKNVIHQDEAKKALSIAICDHYNHVIKCLNSPEEPSKNYAKQNVLMLGPTGVGKTYLVRQIAELIGVPFVKADATRFSETGYVGANVDDLIRDLVQQADGDIELAQYGIIYLDEADKLAGSGSVRGKDVSGRGVQFGLLKLMEETEVDLRSSNDMMSQMKNFMDMQSKGKVEKEVINTRHILFIVSGAFNGLSDIIDSRVSRGSLGIGGELKDEKTATEFFHQVKTQDFIEYGFEPEFVGRLPVRVICSELSEKDLFEILKYSEGSIVKQYVESFKSYGIDAVIDDEAMRAVAKKAFEEKTGARGLVTVLESIFRDFKFELPSTGIKELKVDKNLVNDPKKSLNHVLEFAKNDKRSAARIEIENFEKDFLNKHKMGIRFDENSRRKIADLSLSQGVGIDEVCAKILQSYEHGLSLIKQNTGQGEFVITQDVVENPKKILEKWIRESYSNL